MRGNLRKKASVSCAYSVWLAAYLLQRMLDEKGTLNKRYGGRAQSSFYYET